MKRLRNLCLAALICVPLLSQAQAFKCKQSNGSVSFQDQPCEGGAIGAAIALPRVTGQGIGGATQPKDKESRRDISRKYAGSREQTQDTSGDRERRRAEEEVRLENEKSRAFNKMQRCNYARQQLGVVKMARPIYQRDNQGDRQFVPDENRSVEIAAAEQRVAEECN